MAYEKSWADEVSAIGTRFCNRCSKVMEDRRRTSKGRVARSTLNEGAEDSTDTDTGTSKTDGGKAGTLRFGSGDNGSSHGLSNNAAALLHGVADDARGQATASAVHQQSIGSCLLARLAHESAWETS